MIFMFDAGVKSFPAFRETSVSPVAGSTTRTPHSAVRNAGCDISESTVRASCSRGVRRCGGGVVVMVGALAPSDNASAVAGPKVNRRRLFLICCTQRFVLRDRDFGYAHRSSELRLKLFENEAREILAGRDHLPLAELGHFQIDVPVIEPRHDFR